MVKKGLSVFKYFCIFNPLTKCTLTRVTEVKTRNYTGFDYFRNLYLNFKESCLFIDFEGVRFEVIFRSLRAVHMSRQNISHVSRCTKSHFNSRQRQNNTQEKLLKHWDQGWLSLSEINMDYLGAIRDETPLTNCSVKIQNTILTLSYISRPFYGHVITQSRSTNCQKFCGRIEKIEGKIYAFVIFKSMLPMCFLTSGRPLIPL